MTTFQAFVDRIQALQTPAEVRVYDRFSTLHLMDSEGVGLVTVEASEWPTGGLIADVRLYRHGREVKNYILPTMKTDIRLQRGAEKVVQSFGWVMK